MTSRRSWGRYSTTGAPAPAAAAVTEFRYSQSRSMASSSLPPEEIRATKVPSGVAHLVVAVGQPAGQLGDGARRCGQAFRLVEEGVEVRGNPSSEAKV